MKKFLLILLSVMTLFVTTVPIMAAEVDDYNYNGLVYDKPPSIGDGYEYKYAYLVKPYSGHAHMYLSNLPFSVQDLDSSIRISVNGQEGDVTCKYVKLTWTGSGWKEGSVVTHTGYGGYEVELVGHIGTAQSDKKTLVWASHDVKWFPSGEVALLGDRNFPNPPPVMEQMVEELEKVTVPKIMETTLTLVLCGVGLMALLILLVVLSKVSRRFLPN